MRRRKRGRRVRNPAKKQHQRTNVTSCHCFSNAIVDSEKDSFIPKSPKQSKRNQKETRYWVPSSTRHVIISPDMLNNQTDLDTPYNPNPFGKLDLEARHSKDSPVRKEIHDANGLTRIIQKRKTRLTKMEATVLNRGYVPLMLRLISYIFSVVAIILAGLITRFSVRGGVETRPSTVMAFIVNAVALFYIPWVAKVLHSNTLLITRMNILAGRLGYVRLNIN